MEHRDETREKLLEAAGQVFAEQGFQGATVRDICSKAGTNVAAVNYHFRDKLALYKEVLVRAVHASESEAWRNLDLAVPPEELLRMFIFFMFRNFHRPDKPGWHLKLMMHEMTHPTEGLDHVVEHVIRPNFRRVSQLIAAMVGLSPEDDRVRMCVFSIVGQIHFYIHGRPVMMKLWPELQLNEERMRQISEHIAEFTICALRGMASTER